MDLVEIRKKAKLKKSKPSAKKAAAETTPDNSAKDAGEELLSGQEVASDLISEFEKAEAPDEAVLPESEDVETVVSSFGGSQEEAFLTNIMDALSLDDFEEVADEDDQDRLELLCFNLSDEEYAVEINDVREIVKMVDITEVPKTPDFMLGIISLRGVIIPLMDLRMRLGLEACRYNSKTRIIIASADDRKMGMVVDAVTEVVGLKKGIFEPPPSLLTDINTELLKGVGRYDERLLIVPNLSRVFDVVI
ncbi:MAG: chemotaxis protein CheW [bacterium]|nr:chemotaxis protein CheW [bacterium]